ncbi:MAG: ribbon-helix-helix domain-containing protein [Tolypothrix carrinoi HA7290-LM1]|jgi:predicted DNA-binding protein|nr:ribbon-helix-helix domain-containing protein [Tolypothrix carrinoi HA7290-LM1]
MSNSASPKSNIGARIPVDLLQELSALTESSGKTKSEIINEAISQYFSKSQVTVVDRITTIENKLELLQSEQTNDSADCAAFKQLTQQVNSLHQLMQAILQALGDIKPEIKIVEKLRETISDGERYGGITQTELLEKYQLSYHALDKEAKEKGIPFHQLVKEKTGWYKKDPDKRRSRWLPLDNNVTTTIRELNGDIHSNGKEPTLASNINDQKAISS